MLAVLAALVEVAWAEDDGSRGPIVRAGDDGAQTTAPVPAESEPATVGDDGSRGALAHAVQRYLAGDPAAARGEIQALLARGPSLPADVRREALLWLGDLLYAEGGASAAKSVFEALLDEAPDYEVDAFAHAPEMVAYFEELRGQVVRPTPPVLPDLEPLPPPEIRPWRWKVLIPGGIGYFIDGKPAAGVVVGGLQAATFGVSLGTWIELQNRYPEGGKLPEGSEAAIEEFTTIVTVNRIVSTAAVLAYLVPIGVETGAWAGQRRVNVSLGPGTVTFTGRF